MRRSPHRPTTPADTRCVLSSPGSSSATTRRRSRSSRSSSTKRRARPRAPNEVLVGARSPAAGIMIARDRVGEARTAFDEAVKIDPRNVTALVGQGEVLYRDGRHTEGAHPLRRGGPQGSGGPPAGDRRGEDEDQARAPRRCEGAAHRGAREGAEGNGGPRCGWRRRRTRSATRPSPRSSTATPSISPTPPTRTPSRRTARSRRSSPRRGRAVEAQAKLDQARAKLPDTAVLQRAFGDVAATQGHFDEAIGHYQSALQKNPNDLGTRFELGKTYRRMNRLADAAKEFDTVVATDKEYPNIAVERGLLFEAVGATCRRRSSSSRARTRRLRRTST